jgi:hypothetical protein
MFARHGINFFSWNWLPLLPVFVVYFISGIAETNRHPFDVVEGESEIVAGHMIDYSGMAFLAVLPGRIHQHDCDFGAGCHCCSWAAGMHRSVSWIVLAGFWDWAG